MAHSTAQNDCDHDDICGILEYNLHGPKNLYDKAFVEREGWALLNTYAEYVEQWRR